MALPAYDQCIKASHMFNLLDARGVISVTERQSYILRVRELAKACCGAWLKTEGGRIMDRSLIAGLLTLGCPCCSPGSAFRRVRCDHAVLLGDGRRRTAAT